MKNMLPPKIFLNNNELVWVEEHKYLGIVLSNNNCDNSDIKRQTHAVYRRGNVLISKFHMCTNEVKTQLFKSYITFYCSHLWSLYNIDFYNRMRIAYNNIFRGLFKLGRQGTSQAFVCRNILTFKEVIRKNIFAFKTRIFNSDNVLVKVAVSNSFFLFSSKISLKWYESLY